MKISLILHLSGEELKSFSEILFAQPGIVTATIRSRRWRRHRAGVDFSPFIGNSPETDIPSPRSLAADAPNPF
jgi:hypothetical protein